MLKKIAFFSVCILLIAINSFADTVTLKSGKQIEGKILERSSDLIRIDIEGVTITYFITDVEAINQEKINLPVAEPLVATPQGSAQAEVKSTAKPLPVEPLPVEARPITGKPGSDAKAKLAVLAGLAGFLFILAISVYVYYAICLQFIAKKTNHGPVWMAWVPIANLFLMCKIAGISYLWLLTLLLAFVPIISIIVGPVFTGFIWYKISLARNKPSWIGILAAIPILNFAIMGYLAFTD